MKKNEIVDFLRQKKKLTAIFNIHFKPVPKIGYVFGAIMFCFLMMGKLVLGNNYYVAASPVGSDSNPGTITLPWGSIEKVNTTVFSPGDSIFFRRGDTWTGSGLVVSTGGSSDAQRIVFGAYGSGEKPAINSSSGNGVYADHKNYITICDLSLNFHGSACLSLAGCNFVNVLRVDVSENKKGPGIVASQGGNILIDGCTVTKANSNGILIHGNKTDDLIHDVTVQNCYVTRTNANDGIVIHSGPAGTIAGSKFIIRNNISEHSAEQGYDITTGTNVLMEGNISRLNKQGGITFGHTASGLIVRRHFSENEPTANTSASVKISSPDFTLENSLFIGSASYNKPIISIGPGSDSQPENVKLYNNTFIWNSSSEGNIFFLAQHFTGIQCTIKNLEMKNNIFYSRTSSRGIFSFQQADRPPNFGSGFKFDNNLFFMPNGIVWSVGENSNSPFTFSEYKTSFNQDLSSIETDPLFVDPGSGDFHLLSTSSPAYNTGATLELTQYLDFDSISMPQAGKFDIGAFEFSVSTYGLNANPTGTNAINLTWSDNFFDETGFTIRRKKGIDGIYAEIATTNASVTTYDDGELDVDATYYYQVKAVHPNNIYDWSNEVFASTSIGTSILPDFRETNGLIVFPNPADSFITLWTGIKAGEGKITIFNVAGEKVYSENYDKESKTIGLDKLSTGLFVIQLDTPSNQQRGKFIKR